jgi:uncharacterized protein (TIGR03000 family)
MFQRTRFWGLKALVSAGCFLVATLSASAYPGGGHGGGGHGGGGHGGGGHGGGGFGGGGFHSSAGMSHSNFGGGFVPSHSFSSSVAPSHSNVPGFNSSIHNSSMGSRTFNSAAANRSFGPNLMTASGKPPAIGHANVVASNVRPNITHVGPNVAVNASGNANVRVTSNTTVAGSRLSNSTLHSNSAVIAHNHAFNHNHVVVATGAGAFCGFGNCWWNGCFNWCGFNHCHSFFGWGWWPWLGWNLWSPCWYAPVYNSLSYPYYGDPGYFYDTSPYLDNPDPSMPDQYQRRPTKPNDPKNPEKLPPPVPNPGPAKLDFKLPNADALVWLDDYLTATAGNERTYQTPELQPGKTYSYRLTVVWQQEGQTYRDDRKVDVSANGTTTVDYNALPASSGGQ